jgi:deoxyribodipyrimidine photolyase-related protein
MDGDEPMGGRWNFDAENRSAIPDGYKFPPYLEHAKDDLDLEVIKELEESELDLWGDRPGNTWATTRAGALKQLEHFLEKNFANFGPYEDASTTDNWAIHHSLLSPYLNNGLLHAEEVVEEVRKFISKKKIALASIEGFIRQVIGWREYVNGIYWNYGDEYRNSNHFNHQGQLPPLFDNPELTEINCVKNVVSDVKKRSWVHHIPRLMIISNFAQLTGTSPQALLAWMRRVFIDATDWVMVPNVIGMSMHADGGRMMSKPYIAGGAYISKMTNYCDSCKFNPKLRVGQAACPFTGLYWNFVDQNFEKLAKNPRIVAQVSGIKRLKDMDQVRAQSAERILAIRAGKL